MKIAILGSTLYLAPSERGKIHAPIKLIYDLAEGLAKKGHEVTFFGLVSKEEKRKKYPGLIIDERYCKRPSEADKREKFFKIIYEQSFFKKVIANEEANFDLFYTHIYLVGPLAAMTEKPIIFTHHDSTRIEDYQIMFDFFARSNLFVVPVSKYLGSLFKKRSYFLPYIHNGVDLDDKFKVKKNYFAWAGRISESKGLHIVVNLCIKDNFSLKFAGIPGKFGGLGDQKNYWEKIKKKIVGRKNIEYLGVLSQEETYKFISQAKGFIFPTNGQESFSMVVAESLVSGVPVIAFNNGPMSELITNGINGFLCKNIQDIEKSIKNICSIDRVQCAKVSREKLSSRIMVDNYEKVFERVLADWRKN